MQFLSPLVVLLVTASVIIATPLPESENGMLDISPRVSTAGWAYEHHGRKGIRWDLGAYGYGRCSTLLSAGVDGDSDANDRWSSLEILSGHECKFYRNSFCLKNIPFSNQGGKVKRTGPWTGNVVGGATTIEK